ncbi:glycoside hydrolase family 127 protein [Gluconacetobacter asukensis]|uniref:Glycoside hydrolase family 127 protein n=1 Tax=Gluconacetobacter asukensis TaxID=1017181 RepID=A0A7W4J2Q1_9PROT|nr:glycoside hydrolase family 127 protein [Gluconacetobacter asukensis]MBB2173611.1 glycoside hydrolase family 127 protein [Gluconacetobacter asukensis]
MKGSLSRRALLSAGAVLPVSGLPFPDSRRGEAKAADPAREGVATAVPMRDVRLDPSPWLVAQDVNTAYLLRLDPDRLLHNYREQAGLQPKGAAYGGWEGETIAGHTLGHYLSALSLCHAQTGNVEARRRVHYITAELVACQSRDPVGYVAGFTCIQNGRTLPGKVAFEQIRLGRIHSTGFDLNGAWSPLYNWHKLFAGLLDAQAHCGDLHAQGIMIRLGGYIEGILAPLHDEQLQAVLSCEYGGLNESFAELYARTGEARWLRLARLIHDGRVLDPLQEGRDDLANLHSNTQIPKLVGLARLHEVAGDARALTAARTFWESVTRHYSYVIGGNGDREYFPLPDTISRHLTEQTCETCSSYNMLKLTRQLYGQSGDSRFFDYYERTHLNHIRAAQNPRTGMFCYMTPMMAGAARQYSTSFDDFWCCVGTGMESHAKHGDSIYWQVGRTTLLVNLFIPSRVRWEEGGMRLRLETAYPDSGTVRLAVEGGAGEGERTLGLRVPAWCPGVTLAVNGVAETGGRQDGYVVLRRVWRAGDVIELILDLPLRAEAANDDPRMIAFLHGPTVLAADLGSVDAPFDGPAPALVSEAALGSLVPGEAPGTWRTKGAGRPGDLLLSAFHAQHDRRAAPYLPVFTAEEWTREQARFRAAEQRRRVLDTHAADVFHPGEMQAERDHALSSALSFPVVYRGRNGRDARSGGHFTFTMRTRPGPAVLQVTYWGGERDRRFAILANGAVLARQMLEAGHPDRFFSVRYPLPAALTAAGRPVAITFRPDPDHSAGPVFGVAMLAADGLPPLGDPSDEEAWP